MGCSTEKFLKEGTNLLYENRLYIDGEEKRNAAVKELISPKPNTYFLGIPLKLQLNQLSKELPKEYFEKWLNKKSNRKEKLNSLLSPKQVYQLEKYFVRLNTWMKNNGEEPRIVDSLLIKKNISRLNQFYKNLGYFDVETNFEITELKPKNQEIKYKVNLKEVYIIEDYVEEIKSNELKDMFLFNIDQSFIKSGSSFSIERIEKERDRLIKLFRNNGVYNFQQNSVQFLAKIDSSGIDKRINVVLEINSIQKRINDTLKTIPYKKFKIDEINIFIESLANNDLNYNYKSYYKGFIINSKEKLKYRNKAITDPIFIKKGELYSDNDRTSTYGYFNSLGNFKYPSITYEPNSDSTLIASVFLIPKERFSLGMDLDISHSNIQDVGMGLGITNGIRNLFKGTEILDFRIKSTLGASRNSAVASDRFFNLFELGADIKIKFPKIVLPLPISLEKFIPREMDPITQLTFGTTLQENIGLDKQYFGSSFEYQWSPKKSRKISFKLIDLEFVNNKNVENYFNVYRNSYDRLNTIAKNNSNTSQFIGSDGNLAIPEGSNSFIENVQNGNLQLETQAELDRVSSISERQQRLTVNNLILGSSLSFNTNSQKSLIDENFYQLKWKIEWVGNVLNKLLEFSSEKNNKGEYAINGVSPSQYIKTELDYVKHYQTGRDRILAFRFFGGIALPTGSSLSIPFSRSYFAGGANDNRAWKAYKLGPGTGSNNNEFNEANLKISTNLEYRFPLIGPLKGALFIDAGNIWNIADNIKDSDASFEKISDLSEIAVGSGFGIRYDLDFFVFRFDTAFKTYNPSLEKQNRWLSEFSLKQAVFNIGINYPF
jgi:outer membrane protein assembly factor BamA